MSGVYPESPLSSPATSGLLPLPPKWTGKFRKKPVVVEAARWNPDDLVHAGEMIGWLLGNGVGFHHPSGMGATTTLAIQTLEGEMTAQPGDWIIRGVKGEFYPCKPDIFAATYAVATDDAAPELAAAYAEAREYEVKAAMACRDRDDARSAFAKLAGHFSQGKQSGWSARISGSVLRRLCVAAMCEPPDGSGQPDDADALSELADHPLVAHAIAVARAEARALEARDG